MMRKTFLILIVLYSNLTCFGQTTDSIDFRISGQILDDTFKTVIRNPDITFSFSDGSISNFTADSLGKFYFVKKISNKATALEFSISQKKYFTKRGKIIFDSTLRILDLKNTFYLTPGIKCADTWLLSNVYFYKNSIDCNRYFNPLGVDTMPLIDTVFKIWVQNFLDNRKENPFKIEIASYADYDENDTISYLRLNYIYGKLVAAGLPSERLIKSNCNKQTYNYYKYRDGCRPYYIWEKQPIIIDKKYIDSLTNKQDIDFANQLRQVITFNWHD